MATGTLGDLGALSILTEPYLRYHTTEGMCVYRYYIIGLYDNGERKSIVSEGALLAESDQQAREKAILKYSALSEGGFNHDTHHVVVGLEE